MDKRRGKEGSLVIKVIFSRFELKLRKFLEILGRWT